MENQEQMAKLSILPVNKTVVFYSPIEGKDVLVRTGTIPDGTCFYHSLLHGYSKDYVSMDEKGRKKLVSRLRGSITNKVDRERWEKLSGGVVAKIPFQENVLTLLTDFYRHIQQDKSGRTKIVRNIIRKVMKKGDDNTYKLVLEMIPLTEFEKNILPEIYDKCAEESISTCKDKIVEGAKVFYEKMFADMGNKVDSKRANYCVGKLVTLIEEVVNEAEDEAFKDYITNLKDTSIVVDQYTIGLIANRFNRDIFFLDSHTRMPYQKGGVEHINERKTLILLWTGGVHYEVVGRLLPGNRIQREFSADDPLVTRIRTFLCHPERVPKDYPNLVPFLPKQHRRNIGMKSQSKSRSRSDSEYEPSSDEDSDEDSDEVSDVSSDEEDISPSESYEDSSESPQRKRSPEKRERERNIFQSSSALRESPKRSPQSPDLKPNRPSSPQENKHKKSTSPLPWDHNLSQSPEKKEKSPSPKKKKKKHKHKRRE